VPVATSPRVIWLGPTSWIDVAYESPIGEASTYVGPLPTRVLSPDFVGAVAARVRGVIEQASEHVGRAIAAHQKLCARCARTLMRSAIGSPVDAAAVVKGASAADRDRYATAWSAMGADVSAVQSAMARVRSDAALGVAPRPTPQRVGDAALAHLYTDGGWPLKAGQWADFKMCSCGDPTDPTAKATMLVSGVPVAEPSKTAHHVGGACGCQPARSLR
jgi:hypothetical protein